MRRGYEYQVQQSVADSNGRRLRPDVIISYTEGRKIVIDSKVSLTSYLDMLGADDEKQRSSAAALHVASVRKHVAELRGKSYHEVLGSDVRLDYVLMFIPNEGAFLAAMDLDPKLWETAFDAGVLIISPAHLMSIVKLIEQMWRHDKQNRNAVAIAEEAGRMLDKFRGFLDDMEKSTNRSLLHIRAGMMRFANSLPVRAISFRVPRNLHLWALRQKRAPQRSGAR